MNSPLGGFYFYSALEEIDFFSFMKISLKIFPCVEKSIFTELLIDSYGISHKKTGFFS
jgi:hypothetical protein